MLPSPAPLAVERARDVAALPLAEVNAAFGDDWQPEPAARFLANPDALLLLARWGGALCGVLVGHRLPRLDPRAAEVVVNSLDVLPPWRRLGVGRALVAAAPQWAAEVGASEVWIPTEADNLPANALYRAAGGVPEGSPATIWVLPPLGR